MFKSVISKILVCFIALDLVFAIGVVMIANNFKKAESSARIISDTYLMIEKDFGDVNTNMQNIVKRNFLVQSMSGMYADQPDLIDQMLAPGEGELANLLAAVDDLETHVEKVDSDSFKEEYQALKDACYSMADLWTTLSGMYSNGEFEAATGYYFGNAHDIVAAHEENIVLMAEELAVLVEENQDMLDDASAGVDRAIILGVVLVVLISVLSIIFIVVIIRPLKFASNELQVILNDMKDGKANLSRRLKTQKMDEIGVLVSGINDFLETLQGVIGKITDESGNIYSSVENTSQIVNSSKDDISNVTSVMEELSANMDTANETLQSLSDEAGDVNTSIDEVATKVVNGNKFSGNSFKLSQLANIF